MTSPNDPRLNGRHPEFARMSLRPGIGGLATPEITKFVLTEHGANELLTTGDIPYQLRHSGKTFPLGRYLRSRIRKEAGLNEELIKEERLKAWQNELREVSENALSDQEGPTKGFRKIFEETKQKILNLETRENIFKKKGTL